ncbi:MAG: hypothetical protein ACXWNQ_00110, partial [Anaerolineales bacterium]
MGDVGSEFSLYSDLIKPREAESHLIQIGLLTAVEGYYFGVPAGTEQNQFVRSYVQSPAAPAVYASQAQHDLGAWPFLSCYGCPVRRASAADLYIPPNPSAFKAGPGYISGRVASFVGLAVHHMEGSGLSGAVAAVTGAGQEGDRGLSSIGE